MTEKEPGSAQTDDSLVGLSPEAARQMLHELRRTNQMYGAVLNHTHVSVVALDTHFNFVWVNSAYAAACKRAPAFFPGKNHFDLYPDAENQAIFERVLETGEPFFVSEKPFEFPDQPERQVTYWDWSLVPVKDSAGTRTGVVFTLQDVTERVRSRQAVKAYGEMGREILQILNEPGELKECLPRVLLAVKSRTRVDAVGIRLQKGNDFPYVAQTGFSEEFLLTENTLIGRAADGGVRRDDDGHVCLECTCGLVISSRTGPAKALLTPGGSYWTNDSSSLLDLPPDEDPRPHPRNRCVHQGYASVALVPIRTADAVVGLIQLNDRRKGQFTLETVEILEGVASHIGAALSRRMAEDAVRESEQRLALAATSAHLGIWDWDILNNRMTWDDQMFRLYGIADRPASCGVENWRNAIHPDDASSAWEACQAALRGEKAFDTEFRVQHPDGTVRHIKADGLVVPDERGVPIRMLGINRDVTERKQLERTQLFLLQYDYLDEKLTFFAALARHLAQSLGMDYVCIDRLEGDGLSARTVAVYSDGSFQDNVAYALKDTPCGDLVGRSICCHTAGVRQLYPRDLALQELMAESYIGTTLWGHNGRPIGLIAIIGRKPLKDPGRAEALLHVVAMRAAGEIERLKAEETTRRLLMSTSALTGEAFFSTLVRELAQWTSMRWTLVAEIDPDHAERLRPLALCADGQLRQLPPYEIKGTPSEAAMEKGFYVVEDGVGQRHPADAGLRQLGVVAFKGVGLYDDRRAPIGVLSSFHDQPLKELPPNAREILTLFGQRAAAELLRLRAERELQRRAAELEAFNEALVGREARVIELKTEVNRVSAELGRVAPYPPVWEA